MSLKVLIEDQIKKLFTDSPELSKIKKNEFEIAIAAFANLKYLNGLDYDDLIDGIMGDGGDEGIDLCYIFCNGNLVKTDQVDITKGSSIRVVFFQIKKESGFSVDGFRVLKEGIEEIFNLEIDFDQLKLIGANQNILNQSKLIRKVFRDSRTEGATFSCEVYYVTESLEQEIPEKIRFLENQLKDNILKIPFEFDYLGAQKILDMTKKRDEKITIKFDDRPLDIFETDIETTGYAGFVNGNKLIQSLLDEEGVFKSHLTEGNVRFFLGADKAINTSIIASATDQKKASNFWAMNNGLTIIGDSIDLIESKSYAISNPQIVNGCQTIHCLNLAYSKAGKNYLPESLKVFVKLVKTKDPDTQTDIISATNSQNHIKSANLKANDNIQRNIEEYLLSYGIYYERRDNFYKKKGLTGNKVIGLLKMGQIIHTVVNKEAIVAVNDTTKLFDTPDKYKSIFNSKADYGIYAFSTMLYQKIWSIKNSDIRTNQYEGEVKDLISKGGFIFLHIMSTLLLSFAEFEDGGEKKQSKLVTSFIISKSKNRNEFTKRKDWLFEAINDDYKMEEYYGYAKDILFKSAEEYTRQSGKLKNSLFKIRTFDKEYIIPEIKKFLADKAL